MICGSDQLARPGCPSHLGCYEKEKGEEHRHKYEGIGLCLQEHAGEGMLALYPIYRPETTWPDYERWHSHTNSKTVT